jgi:hypothetical protein
MVVRAAGASARLSPPDGGGRSRRPAGPVIHPPIGATTGWTLTLIAFGGACTGAVAVIIAARRYRRLNDVFLGPQRPSPVDPAPTIWDGGEPTDLLGCGLAAPGAGR